MSPEERRKISKFYDNMQAYSNDKSKTKELIQQTMVESMDYQKEVDASYFVA